VCLPRDVVRNTIRRLSRWTGAGYHPPVMAERPDRNHFYGDAVVYDILHAAGTAAEARMLAGIARSCAGRDGPRTFLEPGCGTARHLRWLVRRGHRGIGLDLAPHMIDDARRRAARAGLADRLSLFVADMTGFATRVRRRIDLAFTLINTIRHLPDDDAMLAHLGEVAACLGRRGAYVVGLSTTAYRTERASRDIWTGSRGRCRVVQTAWYRPPEPPGRLEIVRSVIRVRTPAGAERRECVFALRTYSREELLALIDRSPLRLDRVLDDDGRPADLPAADYCHLILRPAR
jgi:SAM-dependent methyltransferase